MPSVPSIPASKSAKPIAVPAGTNLGAPAGSPFWFVCGRYDGTFSAYRVDTVGFLLNDPSEPAWPYPVLTDLNAQIMTNSAAQIVRWSGENAERWPSTFPKTTAPLVPSMPAAGSLPMVNVIPVLTMVQAATAAQAVAIYSDTSKIGLVVGFAGVVQSCIEWQAVHGLLGNSDDGIWCTFTNGGVSDITDGSVYRDGGTSHWHFTGDGEDIGLITGGTSKPEHGIAAVVHGVGDILGSTIGDIASNPIAAILGGIVIIGTGGAALLVTSAVAPTAVEALSFTDATGITHGALLGLITAYGNGVIWVVEHPAEVGEAVEDVITGLISAIVGVIEGLPSAIVHGIEDVFATIKLVVDLAADALELINPFASSASRTAALGNLDPFKFDSDSTSLYQLINAKNADGTYTNDAEFSILVGLLFIPAFLPLLLLYVATSWIPFLGPMMDRLCGLGSLDTIKDVIRGISSGIAAGQSIETIVANIAEDMIKDTIGVPVGPASIFKIAYMCITGPVFPPLIAILEVIANDPVAQNYEAQKLSALGIPDNITNGAFAAVKCLDASDAEEWLDCLLPVIEQIFPEVGSGLRSIGINPNDLRVLVHSVFECGGDLNVMFDSNISSGGSAPNLSLGAASGTLTSVQAAAVSIGFFGLGWICYKLGAAAQSAENFFIDTILPLLPADVAADIVGAYDVFQFFQQMFLESGQITAKVSVTQTPSQMALYLLSKFQDAQWDVETAISSMVADEFDPNQRTTRPFSIALNKDSQGKYIVTQAAQALFTKLELDYPRVQYQIYLVGTKLGLEQSGVFGTAAQVRTAAATYSRSPPTAPAPVYPDPSRPGMLSSYAQSVVAPTPATSTPAAPGAPIHEA